MEKRWHIPAADPVKVAALQQALRIPEPLCSILVQRGIETYEQARHYFRPSLADLHSPWLMKDMETATSRILQALSGNEKILVYGDYDVDGTTAVSCLYRFLADRHEALDFYIPHRYREGYGVSRTGIDHAVANGFTLIISLDCGIKSVDLIQYAAEKGIDFIICDHHLPDAVLPKAVAILNPKQPDCTYPYKELCGCGVGFKLICALSERLGLPPETPFRYLDLVATAIAADIVPMTGENRILAFHGLERANTEPNPGIRTLSELSGLQKKLTISGLVFLIAPRVNAAGRMDDASKAVRMFIAATDAEAMSYAKQLHSDNSERKQADSAITREAVELVRQQPDCASRRSTVVYQPHWHKGVVGIVASRLIEQYYRPTIVLTRSGDVVAGSARSVPGFNLYEAIHACREYLLGYGGHFAAAGLSMDPDQVEPFREAFEAEVARTIDPSMLTPEIRIDAELRLDEIQPAFYRILGQMEPFGPENQLPQFVVRGVRDTGRSQVVKEQHLRVSIRQGKSVITGIGFGLAEKYPLLKDGKPVDIVFHLEENHWNGNTTLEMRVADLRPGTVE